MMSRVLTIVFYCGVIRRAWREVFTDRTPDLTSRSRRGLFHIRAPRHFLQRAFSAGSCAGEAISRHCAF
jgi:hypothetical protein